jgi:hypothetical protein
MPTSSGLITRDTSCAAHVSRAVDAAFSGSGPACLLPRAGPPVAAQTLHPFRQERSPQTCQTATAPRPCTGRSGAPTDDRPGSPATAGLRPSHQQPSTGPAGQRRAHAPLRLVAACRPWPSVPTDGRHTAPRPCISRSSPCALLARRRSAMRPCATQHGDIQRPTMTHHETAKKRPAQPGTGS